MKAKLWKHEKNWNELNEYLNIIGFNLRQVGKENILYSKDVLNGISDDIFETIDHIQNSLCFIGLGSGLSWLAWALNKKVVMISGFPDPKCEFQTDNVRIINKNVCNSCFNNTEYNFDRSWDWCPATKDFIRTKTIEPEFVFINVRNLILELFLERINLKLKI